MHLGDFYVKQSEFEKGMSIFMKAIDLKEELKPCDDQQIAELYKTMADICENTRNND